MGDPSLLPLSNLTHEPSWVQHPIGVQSDASPFRPSPSHLLARPQTWKPILPGRRAARQGQVASEFNRIDAEVGRSRERSRQECFSLIEKVSPDDPVSRVSLDRPSSRVEPRQDAKRDRRLEIDDDRQRDHRLRPERRQARTRAVRKSYRLASSIRSVRPEFEGQAVDLPGHRIRVVLESDRPTTHSSTGRSKRLGQSSKPPYRSSTRWRPGARSRSCSAGRLPATASISRRNRTQTRAEASGIGRTFKVSSAMIPSVPIEPVKQLGQVVASNILDDPATAFDHLALVGSR